MAIYSSLCQSCPQGGDPVYNPYSSSSAQVYPCLESFACTGLCSVDVINQCGFQIEYADGSGVSGPLVTDVVSLGQGLSANVSFGMISQVCIHLMFFPLSCSFVFFFSSESCLCFNYCACFDSSMYLNSIPISSCLTLFSVLIAGLRPVRVRAPGRYYGNRICPAHMHFGVSNLCGILFLFCISLYMPFASNFLL